MRSHLLSLVALLVCALGLQAQTTDVILIGDERVPARAYSKWLVTLQGESHARGFVRSWLIHREAQRQGIATTVAEAAASVEAVIEERVRNAFRGNRDSWRQELALTGMDEGGYQALQAHLKTQDIELEALVRAARDYTEPAVRAEWEKIYGRDGRTLQLRMIALDPSYFEFPSGPARDKARIRRKEAEEQTLFEGARLRTQLLAGANFTELAKARSHDQATAELGGLLPLGFDSTGFSEQHKDAVYSLQVGDVSQPAMVRGRVLLLQLVSEQQTSFEKGRAKALEALQARPVSTSEIDALLQRLHAAAPDTRLPALAAPTGTLTEPVLSIGDTTITYGEYATWLRRRIGHSMAPRFLRSYLVEQLATANDLTVTPQEVDTRVQELVVITAKQMFRGNVDAWAKHLKSRGKSRGIFERQTAHRSRTSLLAEKALLRNRKSTEPEIRALWINRYGPNGRTRHVRMLLKLVGPQAIPAGATAEERARLQEKAREDTRVKLAELKARIEDGEDFAALARRFSDDKVYSQNGGLMDEPFSKRNWPKPFTQAVAALRIGHLTEPLFESGAWFLFELVDDKQVAFDEVRAELEIELKQTRPAAIQVAVFMKELLEERPWRVLSGMYQ